LEKVETVETNTKHVVIDRGDVKAEWLAPDPEKPDKPAKIIAYLENQTEGPISIHFSIKQAEDFAKVIQDVLATVRK